MKGSADGAEAEAASITADTGAGVGKEREAGSEGEMTDLGWDVVQLAGTSSAKIRSTVRHLVFIVVSSPGFVLV